VKPRVAFTLIGGRHWTGGYNYLLNLLRVLAREAPDALTPVLFVGLDVPGAELEPFARIGGCEVVHDSAFDAAHRTRLLAHALLLGGDGRALAALHRARIDVVFEAAVYLGWRLGSPSIAWIPDLQHRFLPHLFGRVARWRREVGFRAQVASGRIVMCSSEDTRAACGRFYPGASVRAVRFAVQAPAPVDAATIEAVRVRHCLPERYFFMPNQFWAHKNHRLVLEALRRLAARGETVTVLASGEQADPRNPAYVPALLADIRAAGLHAQLITPGLLPYEDLAPLMQGSVALLNPSTFEGWSTTVEEARSAGVPMLLSDIAVHREQAGETACYFDPSSPDALAEALLRFKPLAPDARAARREAAVAEAQAGVARFAGDFVALVEHTLSRGVHPR